jgi:hypothetical protein
MPILADRGMSRGQRGGSLTVVNLSFLDRSRYVRFEVFTAVTMKNCVFWDVTLCSSCKNRRFGGTQSLLHQGDKNW